MIQKHEPSALVLTKASNAWPADTLKAKPAGVGICSLQIVMAGTFAGSTITGKIQGTIDGTNWEDVADGSVAKSAAASDFAGGSDNLISLQPYKSYRFAVTETGDADDGATVTFSLYAEYEG